MDTKELLVIASFMLSGQLIGNVKISFHRLLIASKGSWDLNNVSIRIRIK